MPEDAKPWESDYLLPNESFSATLSEPGVYDYYCHPHEHAGMVGRIVVGPPHSWNEAVNKSKETVHYPQRPSMLFRPLKKYFLKG
jgi:hypothetical protein